MSRISNETLYRELLILSEQLSRVESLAVGNLELLRAINDELDEGRAQIETTKKRLGFAGCPSVANGRLPCQ